jgi:hypothetical protein
LRVTTIKDAEQEIITEHPDIVMSSVGKLIDYLNLYCNLIGKSIVDKMVL